MQPLAQVRLVLQNSEIDLPDMPGLDAEVLPVDRQGAKFDMLFVLEERHDSSARPAGIEGALEYATDLYDESTMLQFLTRLQRLLHAVVADPDQLITEIDLLGERERHQVLVEWNDTTHPVDPVTLPDLFERQVTASPEAVAVVCGDQRVSYRQLAGRVNQLARLLILAGVGPESVVALALPRSVELVAAVLAVMTAGGAY
ncbi:AMP-binding protein, partial [Rugosimonospora africana]|uniref:AMP-binding protein n=1 Tax=Rugosimonospora africana TaxID=556532 RepID=UPI001EF3026D